MDRKERYISPDATNIVMEDAYQPAQFTSQFGFSYVLNKDERECVDIFRKEREKNARFKAIWREAEEAVGEDPDVYAIVKRAYTMETALYKTFNKLSRNLRSFFEWESFPFKGFWLLLHKDLIRQTSSPPPMLYRGMSIPMVTKVDNFVRFIQFSSTSSEQEVALSFLEGREGHSTLFEIEAECGLSLAEFSEFEDEAEFLLRPNDAFRVVGVKKEASGLTVIRLTQEGSALF